MNGFWKLLTRAAIDERSIGNNQPGPSLSYSSSSNRKVHRKQGWVKSSLYSEDQSPDPTPASFWSHWSHLYSWPRFPGCKWEREIGPDFFQVHLPNTTFKKAVGLQHLLGSVKSGGQHSISAKIDSTLNQLCRVRNLAKNHGQALTSGVPHCKTTEMECKTASSPTDPESAVHNQNIDGWNRGLIQTAL